VAAGKLRGERIDDLVELGVHLDPIGL